MNFKKLNLVLFIPCFLILLFQAHFVLAVRMPEIQYPGIPFSDVETPNQFIQKINDRVYPAGDILALYVRYFYSLIVILGALAVFASIVYGGFQYLLGVGKPGLLVIARDRISSGLLGLLILFGAQFILTAINPRLAIFNFTAPDPERCDCARPQDQLSDYCKVYCQVTQPAEDDAPMYIEIPLGRLVERVIKASEEARQTAIIVKNKAENLRRLSEELKNLTDQCSCSGSSVKTECGAGSCSGGSCVGDPCANNRSRINELNNVSIPRAINILDRWKEQAKMRRIMLANEKFKLELTEILMRDSVFSPTNYQSFIGLENRRVRKLNHWSDIDIGVSGLAGPSISMPTPPAGCSSDASSATIPSCTVCGETLFCYGNNYRTCSTDQKFNSGRGLIPASEFPEDVALYNGMDFPVPSHGVVVCNDNIFGCDNNACKIVKGPEDPATFYVPEKGNEELITTIESLSLSIYDPPAGECPTGQIKPYTTCDGENCVSIDSCGSSDCSGNSCAITPDPDECPAGQSKPHAVCDNYSCRMVNSCGPSQCSPGDDNACGVPPDSSEYENFARTAREFAISPFQRILYPPFSFNHQRYINAIAPYLRYNNGADCGVYVAAVVKNTIDPSYPEVGTVNQESYLRRNSNFDCFNISGPSQLRPGDILFSRPNGYGAGGHTLIWLEDGTWQSSLNDYLPTGPSAWYPRMAYACRYKNF